LRPAEAAGLAQAAALLLRAAWLAYHEWKEARQVAKFDAATVVEALEWTFEPFVAARGVIREPNDEQIAAYLADVKAFGQEVREKIPDAPDGNDPVDLMTALEDLNLAEVAGLTEKMAGIVAALCGGDPSRETILALPPRRRTMFYGWLQSEVMSPEAAPGAGNPQVRTLRSAAAG
jgi:hypothetical protein